MVAEWQAYGRYLLTDMTAYLNAGQSENKDIAKQRFFHNLLIVKYTIQPLAAMYCFNKLIYLPQFY